MSRYVLMVDGAYAQGDALTLAELADRIVAIRGEGGHVWDVRVRTSGRRYRLPTEAEGCEVVAAALERLT